jgi:uncharacterized protein (TIGR02246 family)
MKSYVPPLVGLAIALALPAAAQQMKCDGPQDACQAIEEIGSKYIAAEGNHDAAAIAALYTSDGILVPEGPIVTGRDEIEKLYSDFYKTVRVSNPTVSVDQVHIHGNMAWGLGSYSEKRTGSDKTSRMIHGHWSAVWLEDGGAWKLRMLTANQIETPPGQAAPGTSASR